MNRIGLDGRDWLEWGQGRVWGIERQLDGVRLLIRKRV